MSHCRNLQEGKFPLADGWAQCPPWLLILHFGVDEALDGFPSLSSFLSDTSVKHPQSILVQFQTGTTPPIQQQGKIRVLVESQPDLCEKGPNSAKKEMRRNKREIHTPGLRMFSGKGLWIRRCSHIPGDKWCSFFHFVNSAQVPEWPYCGGMESETCVCVSVLPSPPTPEARRLSTIESEFQREEVAMCLWAFLGDPNSEIRSG